MLTVILAAVLRNIVDTRPCLLQNGSHTQKGNILSNIERLKSKE